MDLQANEITNREDDMKGYAQVRKQDIPINEIRDKVRAVNDWIKATRKDGIEVLKPKWWQLFKEPVYKVKTVSTKPNGVDIRISVIFGVELFKHGYIRSLERIIHLFDASNEIVLLDIDLSIALNSFNENKPSGGAL